MTSKARALEIPRSATWRADGPWRYRRHTVHPLTVLLALAFNPAETALTVELAITRSS